MELCQLTKVKHTKPWLVQLATGAKRKVTDFIVDCEVKLQDHKTRNDLNILPLGSYDMIIGMDWLERNKVVLNYFSNTFTYIAEDQILRTVNGILKTGFCKTDFYYAAEEMYEKRMETLCG